MGTEVSVDWGCADRRPKVDAQVLNVVVGVVRGWWLCVKQGGFAGGVGLAGCRCPRG